MSKLLIEAKVCRVHGPTVEVRWITLGPCPLCQSYAAERKLREMLDVADIVEAGGAEEEKP